MKKRQRLTLWPVLLSVSLLVVFHASASEFGTRLQATVIEITESTHGVGYGLSRPSAVPTHTTCPGCNPSHCQTTLTRAVRLATHNPGGASDVPSRLIQSVADPPTSLGRAMQPELRSGDHKTRA
jgi:hypothetical protein